MKSFEEQLAMVPSEIKNAWSSNFVFILDIEKEKFWHFPARQWSEEQIKKYFFDRYQADSHFITYPAYQVKHLIIEKHPELFVIIPV
ncbi:MULTISPECIES: hypothetical protein [Enterococcus]|uniref:Uncharacterized protein n=1 Tax=Candidatus Enterococcus ferrettii TaxID=2815324 RepID=A0ABV0EQJ6_9ENTE|nr:hypothetical protein [Enterococcus sp. 665A]MBO1339238.1 hypothetical protein [Enterococcus sp. 665A]